jgi:hypothetical protein
MRPVLPSRFRRVKPQFLIALSACLIFIGASLLAQHQKTNVWEGNIGTQVTSMRNGDFPTTGMPTDQEITARRQAFAALIAEYHKKNLADTGKLVALTQELNSGLIQPDRASPTPADMQKAKEIEKLAKRLKDRLMLQ